MEKEKGLSVLFYGVVVLISGLIFWLILLEMGLLSNAAINREKSEAARRWKIDQGVNVRLDVLEEQLKKVVETLNHHKNEATRMSNINEKVDARLNMLEAQLQSAWKSYNFSSDQLQRNLSALERKTESIWNVTDGYGKDLVKFIGEFRSWKATVCTDLRLSAPEKRAVWRNIGWNDEPGYVITGVSNFNQDNYVDEIDRRRIQKLVNGKWVNI